MTDYELLNKQLISLIDGVSFDVSKLANASALLYESMENVSWVGFYILKENELVLGPFQGKIACSVIPLNKGVCGTSAGKNETILVKNVHEFPGHIACDSGSNSEIVIPINVNNKLYGVLDIDSYELARFNEADQIGLESFVKTLERYL